MDKAAGAADHVPMFPLGEDRTPYRKLPETEQQKNRDQIRLIPSPSELS